MMKNFTRLLRGYVMIASAMIAFVTVAQTPVPFTAGNFVVYRVGDGVNALPTITNSTPVFLDEYTPAGVLVQSVAMPTAANGSNHAFTASSANATSQGEGMINLSANGQFLVLTGYDAPYPGTQGLNQTLAVAPRVIGLVDYNATINTTTGLTSGFSFTTALKSAILNVTDIWVVGASDNVQYTTIGSTSSTAITAGIPSTGMGLSITNGQLYMSTTNGTGVRIGTVGTGLPTTATQTVTSLPGFPTTTGNSPTQFVFADLDPSVPGVDVLYVADVSVGLRKFSLVSGTWQSNGAVGANANLYQGLTAMVSGTTVTLFATRVGANATTIRGGELVKLTDASGYNGAFSGTPTVLASIAIPNTASFKGVALVPQPPPVKVAIKTFLQGAYSSGLGRHKDVTAAWTAVLNANALTQPYNTAAFGNYAGTESVSAGFFTSTGATTDIVDWVLLELRDATTPTTVLARRAAFIRVDGRIVDLDGTSDVTFTGVSAPSCYVVVRHRNHLPIRSASTIALSGTATLYDFTTAESKAYQDGTITSNAAMQDVSGGGTVFAMWGGNANSNTKVSFTGVNNDSGTILGALGGNQGTALSSVYNSADLNLDGNVKYTGTNNDSGLLLSVLGSNQAAVYSQHQ